LQFYSICQHKHMYISLQTNQTLKYCPNITVIQEIYFMIYYSFLMCMLLKLMQWKCSHICHAFSCPVCLLILSLLRLYNVECQVS
jgi:hypothetical protein